MCDRGLRRPRSIAGHASTGHHRPATLCPDIEARIFSAGSKAFSHLLPNSPPCGVKTQVSRIAPVVEPLPYSSPRRQRPTDDTIDAELIGRSVLGLDEALLRRPRSEDAIRTGLPVPVVAREELSAKRTCSTRSPPWYARSVSQLDACRPLSKSHISTIARLRARNEDLGLATVRAESIRLAHKVIHQGAWSQQA